MYFGVLNVSECNGNPQILNCSSSTYPLYNLRQITSPSLNFSICKMEILLTSTLLVFFFNEIIHANKGQGGQGVLLAWLLTLILSSRQWPVFHHHGSPTSLDSFSFPLPSYLSAHTQSLHIALDFGMVCWKHSLQLPCQRSCTVPHGTERAGARRHVCTATERSKVSQEQSLTHVGS